MAQHKGGAENKGEQGRDYSAEPVFTKHKEGAGESQKKAQNGPRSHAQKQDSRQMEGLITIETDNQTRAALRRGNKTAKAPMIHQIEPSGITR